MQPTNCCLLAIALGIKKHIDVLIFFCGELGIAGGHHPPPPPPPPLSYAIGCAWISKGSQENRISLGVEIYILGHRF
jgi:hypothetical protein